MLLRIT